jgi:hypothetical protein
MLMRARVSWPGSPSGWLDLNNHNGYELGADTRKEERTTLRRRDAQAPHLPGVYTYSVVPEMVTVGVGVWVVGDTHHQLWERCEALRSAFSQLSYTMDWLVGDMTEVWSCTPADHTIATQREFWHNKRALFTADVPRFPDVERRKAAPTGDWVQQ